jgi:Caspase domain
MDKRRGRGGRWEGGLLALLVPIALCLAPCAAKAELYGLVVGIDDYLLPANHLDGAVNDAKDIAQSLQHAGAKEVVVLLNDDARKARIVAEWDRLVGNAKPGDTFIFSYAGHGGQEPAPPDRRDKTTIESFLLGHFAPSGPGTAERIVDDEVFAWLEAADKKGVKVVFVADSCHSGGMERSASAPGVKFRRMQVPAITDDQLKFPPPEISKLTPDDFQNVTFVAAVPPDKLVPEIDIEGQKRGALSWAFSRAMEGRADKDGDGKVTELELLSFIVPAVHALVESQQTPSVLPLRARSVPLLTLRESKAPAAPTADVGDDALKLKVAVEGVDASPLADLPYVEVVADKTQADLIWSADGTVEHVVGGVVAENVDAAAIKGVASKWAALKWLKHQASLTPVQATLASGNQRYKVGDVVQIGISDAKYPHLTMFNLPPDGRVEFFIPDPAKPQEAAQDWSLEPIHERFKVDKPPYGAEHMVAIFSKDDLADLHAALASMTTPARAEALRPMLEQALSGHDVQIGILDVYTGNGG